MKKLYVSLICAISLFVFALIPTLDVGADQELESELISEELPVIVIETEEPQIIETEPEEETTEELGTDPLSEIEKLLQDEDFLTLCATVHFEAGEANTLEAKFCVAKVVLNRLNDTDTWGYTSIQDVVYAPGQFSVVHKKMFELFKEQLKMGEFDENVLCSVMAAYFAYFDLDLCVVEPEVQYFNIDYGYNSWGGHKRAFECGGNCFYYK